MGMGKSNFITCRNITFIKYGFTNAFYIKNQLLLLLLLLLFIIIIIIIIIFKVFFLVVGYGEGLENTI